MKNMFKELLNTHLKKAVMPFLFSVVLLIVGYFLNDLPILKGENQNQLFVTQKLCEWLRPPINSYSNDALFVNVAYDKELVDTKDINYNKIKGNAVVGKTAITDRNKLYRFLKILKDQGKCKYVILDVMFDPKDESKADSLLYPLIAEMENIVIARDNDIRVPYVNLFAKSALASYYTTITDDSFVRYQYLSKDGYPYVPLKVYEDLFPELRFKQYGLSCMPIYTSGGRLCHNSCFIAFDSGEFSSFSNVSKMFATKNYYNLGTDLLDDPTFRSGEERDNNILKLSANKYVIIGDYVDDLHGTYMGMKPGPFILYRALKALEDDKHVVSFWRVFYWFVIFAAIFWCIIYGENFNGWNIVLSKRSCWIRRIVRLKLFRFIISSLGFAAILFVCSLVEYIVVNDIYNIVLPTYIFMLTKLICDYLNFEKS